MQEVRCSKRAIFIVLDSVGIGAMPDAAQYGDSGANTWGRVADAMPDLELPYLNGLGLFQLVPQFRQRKQEHVPVPVYTARMAEQSRGKDTITGHWELSGVVTQEPFPTFPQGFPDPLLQLLQEKTGYTFLGNEVASGTEIIARLGSLHQQTGQPILYTSADSVLQIAAHEEVIAVSELYRICQIARQLTKTGPYKVGRVIARPFTGHHGQYQRTANRHDFSLSVPSNNLLQDLLDQQKSVLAVGKIQDIFVGVSFTAAVHTTSNEDGMAQTMKLYQQMNEGLLLVNLVDFDMKYGHRRDITGYGQALQVFDQWLGELLPKLQEDTVLIITADHGCDPGYAGTDHTREYVPLFMAGTQLKSHLPLTTYSSFADLAATLAQYFQIAYTGAGDSFYKEVFQ